MKTLALAASVALLGASAILSGGGCAHPYSGPPEHLHMPKEKEPSADEGGGDKKADEKEQEGEDTCRTNFFAEPFKGRRRARDARRLGQKADGALLDAEQADGSQRRAKVVDAMSTLEHALDKDPYAPLPTYKFAVAYALVGRKACALAFLERLGQLQKYPDVEREAHRTVQRALRDPAFEAFHKEAEDALGE